MIISHTKKYIFLRTRKTASSSIELALFEKHFDINKDLLYTGQRMPIPKKYSKGKLPHCTAIRAKSLIPLDQWNSYFKFAFVRNPFDLFVSAYNYECKINKMGKPTQKGFIIWAHDIINNDKKKWKQSNMMCNENGEIIINFVGKYENLQKDLNIICRKIGIEKINISEYQINKGFRKNYDYMSFYTKGLLKKCRKFFKSDLQKFYPNLL